MTAPLWSLFIAALLHGFSKLPLIIAQVKQPGGYDNRTPRQQQNQLNEWGQRALAAHQNQIESFPLFAAGVLVVTATETLSESITALCIIYLIARVLFIGLYVKNLATYRSIVWGVGFLASLALIIAPAWA